MFRLRILVHSVSSWCVVHRMKHVTLCRINLLVTAFDKGRINCAAKGWCQLRNIWVKMIFTFIKNWQEICNHLRERQPSTRPGWFEDVAKRQNHLHCTTKVREWMDAWMRRSPHQWQCPACLRWLYVSPATLWHQCVYVPSQFVCFPVHLPLIHSLGWHWPSSMHICVWQMRIELCLLARTHSCLQLRLQQRMCGRVSEWVSDETRQWHSVGWFDPITRVSDSTPPVHYVIIMLFMSLTHSPERYMSIGSWVVFYA